MNQMKNKRKKHDDDLFMCVDISYYVMSFLLFVWFML